LSPLCTWPFFCSLTCNYAWSNHWYNENEHDILNKSIYILFLYNYFLLFRILIDLFCLFCDYLNVNFFFSILSKSCYSSLYSTFYTSNRFTYFTFVLFSLYLAEQIWKENSFIFPTKRCSDASFSSLFYLPFISSINMNGFSSISSWESFKLFGTGKTRFRISFSFMWIIKLSKNIFWYGLNSRGLSNCPKP